MAWTCQCKFIQRVSVHFRDPGESANFVNFVHLRGDCAVGKLLGHLTLLPLDASHVCGHFDSFHADMKFSCKMGGGKIEKFDLVKKHNSSGPARIFGIRDL